MNNLRVQKRFERDRFDPEMLLDNPRRFRDLSNKVGEPLVRFESDESRFQEQFLDRYIRVNRIEDPDIMRAIEKEVLEDLVRLREFELNPRLKEENSVEYEILRRRILSVFSKHDSRGNFSEEIYYNYVDSARDLRISKGIIASGNADEWIAKREDLEARFEDRKISYREYLNERDEINDEAIEASSDEELKQAWREYQQDSEAQEYLVSQYEEHQPANDDESVVKDEEALNDAFTDAKIDSGDFDLEVKADGSAIVKTENDFSVEVFVYQEPNGGFVYYLRDEYLGEPLRVMAEDLLDTLDDRQLDSYLSSELAPLVRDQESLSDIPDEDIVMVARSLVGDGESRGYKIDGDDRLVLDNLVQLLVVTDEKHPGLEKKVAFLKNFLTKDQRKDSLRRFLVNYNEEVDDRGEISISDLEGILG